MSAFAPDPALRGVDDASLRNAAVRETLSAVATLQRKLVEHADRLMLEHPKEVGELTKNLAVALQSAIASQQGVLRRNADTAGHVPPANGRWTDEDHERFYELVSKTYSNPSYPCREPLGWDPLTPEDRAELEGLKKRQLPLDPSDPLAGLDVPGLTAAYRATLERDDVPVAEYHWWTEYLLEPWERAGYAVGFGATGPEVPKEVWGRICELDPLADALAACAAAAKRSGIGQG